MQDYWTNYFNKLNLLQVKIIHIVFKLCASIQSGKKFDITLQIKPAILENIRIDLSFMGLPSYNLYK